MIFLDRLNSPRLDFTQNLSVGKIIKFQQSQALTSHFESLWSIVSLKINFIKTAKERPVYIWSTVGKIK